MGRPDTTGPSAIDAEREAFLQSFEQQLAQGWQSVLQHIDSLDVSDNVKAVMREKGAEAFFA